MKMTIVCLDKQGTEAYETMQSLIELLKIKYDITLITNANDTIEDEGLVLISSSILEPALLSSIKNLNKAVSTYYLHDRLAYSALKTDKVVKGYIEACDYVFTFIPRFLQEQMGIEESKICAANSLSYVLFPNEEIDERDFLYKERQTNFIDLRKSSENPEYDSYELDYQIISAIFKGIVPVLPMRFKDNCILSGEDFDKMTLILNDNEKVEEQIKHFNVLDARKQMLNFIELLKGKEIFLSGFEFAFIHHNTFDFVKGMAEGAL